MSRERRALEQVGLADIDPHSGGPAGHRTRGWIGRLALAERRRVAPAGGRAGPCLWWPGLTSIWRAAEGREEDRRRAIEDAMPGCDTAERIDPGVPTSPVPRRTRYHAALGNADLAARIAAWPTGSSRGMPGTGRSSAPRCWPRRHPRRRDGAARRRSRKTQPRSGPRSPGTCLLRAGAFLEAVGVFNACVARGPDHPHVIHFDRGWPSPRSEAARRPGGVRSGPRAGPQPRAEATRGSRPGRAPARAPASRSGAGGPPGGRRRRSPRARRSGCAAGRRWPAWAAAEAEVCSGGCSRRAPATRSSWSSRGMSRLETDLELARDDFDAVLHVHPRHAMAHYGMARVIRTRDRRAGGGILDAGLRGRSRLARRPATACVSAPISGNSRPSATSSSCSRHRLPDACTMPHMHWPSLRGRSR